MTTEKVDFFRTIPLVRKVLPKLLAHDMVSVQPMQLSWWQQFRLFRLNTWRRRVGAHDIFTMQVTTPNNQEYRLTPAQYVKNLDAVLQAMFKAKVETHPVIDNYGMLRLYNQVRWVQLHADRIVLWHDFLRGWRWMWFNTDGNQWLVPTASPTALAAVEEAMTFDVQRGRFELAGWGNRP